MRIEGREIAVRAELYRPLENEQCFASYIEPGMKVLEMGCGCGIISVFAALKGATVTAVDINPTAVENTRENCVANGVGSVDVRISDMFDAVDGRYDRIVCHPPYFTMEFDRVEEQWSTSTRFIPMLFAEGARYLAPGGRLIMGYPSFWKDWLCELAEAHGWRLVEKKRMPPKPRSILLDCMLHFQFGWMATFYVFEPTTPDASAVRLPAIGSVAHSTGGVEGIA
jgi:SAM-dependent methyltransferase